MVKSDEEKGQKLDIRGGSDEQRERVFAMNLGGESSAIGAPVVISSGLFVHDPVEHDRLLRENPPGPQIPAQDPTPLPEYEDGEIPVGRGRGIPATGGPAQVRRVHDRTPEVAYADAQRPYNDDTSVAQRSQVYGTDAAEETAEDKHEEGGAKAKVARDARAEAEDRERQKQAQEKAANDRADEKKKASSDKKG